jgi:hypothetical protein
VAVIRGIGGVRLVRADLLFFSNFFGFFEPVVPARVSLKKKKHSPPFRNKN